MGVDRGLGSSKRPGTRGADGGLGGWGLWGPLRGLPPLFWPGCEALGFGMFDISEERSVEKIMGHEMGPERKPLGTVYTRPRFVRSYELNLLSFILS